MNQFPAKFGTLFQISMDGSNKRHHEKGSSIHRLNLIRIRIEMALDTVKGDHICSIFKYSGIKIFNFKFYSDSLQFTVLLAIEHRLIAAAEMSS